jgi:uncharacterized protein (DUF1778 family)
VQPYLGWRALQRTRRLCVRVSPEEEAILKEAAWRHRLTLAEWLRRTMLREAAKKERERRKE